MAATASALKAQVTPVVDVSDLLRAALVQGVSAFDHFIHEEVRVRMIGLAGQAAVKWPPAYGRFRISLEAFDRSRTGGTRWLEEEIRAQHSYLAFQQPEKVADAIRLVSDVELWPSVANFIGVDTRAVKTQLKLIVDRRNQIAHEADMDPTPPRSRYPISRNIVDSSLDFLDVLVEAIVNVS